MRILVTGSRSWQDRDEIAVEILRVVVESGVSGPGEVTIVHGGAVGADRFAAEVARRYGFAEEVYRPNWRYEGKRAGILRNLVMVEAGADRCLAFVVDGSRGASHCAAAAEAAGIPVERFER